MPEPRGTAARGQVFTTPLFRIFGVKNLDFIGDLPGRPRENSQKPLPVSKVGLNRAAGEAGGGWDAWVPQYLKRHCESPPPLRRYSGIWSWLALWLQEKGYRSPRAITYRNALQYIDWRTSRKKNRGKRLGVTPPSWKSKYWR